MSPHVWAGAVFDLDGVLVETEHLQFEGWNVVLAPFGVSLSKTDYLAFAGKSGKLIEKELLVRFGLAASPGTLLEKKEKWLIHQFSTGPVRKLFFAEEAVRFFIDRQIPVAVASSGPLYEIELKLQRTGLRKYFQVIVSRDDVTHAKPHPEQYQKAVEKLGLKPSQCVAFEDTEFGVESASAAGLSCIAIPHEFTLGQDFSKAVFVANQLNDAIEWIKQA